MLDFLMGSENHHPIEYQLYCLNLRANARERVAAYFRERDAVE